MFTRECEACGRQIFLYDEVDGFKVCSRCLKVQKKTGTPMAEMVAKNVAVVAEASAWRRFRGNVGDAVLVLAICTGCYVYFWKPEWIRFRGQVPVSLYVRDVMTGEGNLLEIRNDSGQPLTDVVLMVTGRQGNPRIGNNIGYFAPGQSRTLRAEDPEQKWVVERGDKITIQCEPFFPVVFTAEEVGVK